MKGPRASRRGAAPNPIQTPESFRADTLAQGWVSSQLFGSWTCLCFSALSLHSHFQGLLPLSSHQRLVFLRILSSPSSSSLYVIFQGSLIFLDLKMCLLHNSINNKVKKCAFFQRDLDPEHPHWEHRDRGQEQESPCPPHNVRAKAQ